MTGIFPISVSCLMIQSLFTSPLQVTPDDASLLCALGDVTLDDKHYHEAWGVSKGRSTRAQRSLARSAQRQEHWDEVKPAKVYGFGFRVCPRILGFIIHNSRSVQRQEHWD